jgi:multisubunit Na+/H+ antiporter MnhE subunit
MNKKSDNETKTNGSELKQFVFLTIILYCFWLILSGVFDIKFLIIGLVSSIVIAWLTQSLLRLNSTSGQSETFLAYDFPYLKFLIYCSQHQCMRKRINIFPNICYTRGFNWYSSTCLLT